MGSIEEKVTRKIHTTFFMRVCKYVNQKVRRIGEQNGKSFKGISKTKKKKNMEIEFDN